MEAIDYLIELQQKECLEEYDFIFSRLFAKSEEERVKLLIAVLSSVSRAGHLCMKFSPAISPSIDSLWKNKLDAEKIKEIKDLLTQAFYNLPGHLYCAQNSPFYKNGSCLYLKRNWEYETRIIEGWRELKASQALSSFDRDDLENRLKQSSLNLLQKTAVFKMFLNPVTCLTGGPGTGKTFTASFFIEQFLKIFPDKGLKIVLSAPTGKATQRLYESVLKNISDERIVPKTLHSLLKSFNPHQAWKFDPYLLLQGSLFIVDEASMIDAALMAQLFQSIPQGSRLILLGDPFQLPAVENGALFADIIEYEKTLVDSVVVSLEESVRIENPHIKIFSQVLKEAPANAFELLSSVKTSTFHTQFLSEFNEWAQFLKGWMRDNLRLEEEDEELDAEQITTLFSFYQKGVLLTPLRKGPLGVNELNTYIQKKYHEMKRGRRRIEPILITSSAAKEGLTNGDFGLLVSENVADKSVSYALFPHMKEYKKIPSSLLPSYEMAYALSIHKSQGSEYNHVDLLIPEGSESFSKEIFYTAVTRAKKSLTLIAHPETFKLLLEKDARRISGFCERCSDKSAS